MARRIEVEIIGDPRSVQAAFGRSATAAQKFQRSMEPMARAAKLAIVGIAGLGAVSVKLANDFNRTSSQMVGLAGVGSKQVEEWKKAMLDLAPVVGQAPEELAKSLYFIASSGIPASKALDALKISAMGATAGLGETEVVADAVTSAMNAYADVNLTAAQAADVLAATVREGKGEAAEIAPVLGNILPIASQLGVGFNEIGAAMASMTRLGFDAATAATNLSGVMSALLKPSVQAEQAFHDVGTSSADLQKMLAGRGLLQTLQFLKDRFEGNNAAMARAFPNVRALRGVLSLVGKAGDDTAAVFKRMEDNTGALGHAFRAAADTDAFRMQQALAELEAAGIRIGTTIAPAVADLAGFFADGAEAAGRHATATKAVATAVLGLSTAIIAANTALKIYNSNLVVATGMQGRLLAVARFAGPIGAVATGIIALGIAFKALGLQADAATGTFDATAAAADRMDAAFKNLQTTTHALREAHLENKGAMLASERAERNYNQTVKQSGKHSLEAREALNAWRQAQQHQIDTQIAANEATRRHNQGLAEQRGAIRASKEQTQGLIKAMAGVRDRMTEATKVAGDYASKSEQAVAQQEAEKVAVDEAKAALREQITAYHGNTTAAGRAAQRVLDYINQVDEIPDAHTTRILLGNMNHSLDQVEALRAGITNVPNFKTVDFYIRTHGSITAPTGVAEGSGAAGAIVNRPTIALIGEAGPEAVVPLHRTRGNGPLGRLGAGGGNSFTFVFPHYVGDKSELERSMRGAIDRMIRKGASPGLRRY